MLLRILLAMHYLHTNWFFHQDLVIYKFSPPQKNICYFSFFYVLVFIIVLLFRFSESVNDRYNYLQYIYIYYITKVKSVYRRTSERSSSGAQDSCFDLIWSHQLRKPDELNLMTMESHQICSNSACGLQRTKTPYTEKEKRSKIKTGKSRAPPLVAMYKSNQEGGNLTIHGLKRRYILYNES